MAERAFEAWIAEHAFTVHRHQHLIAVRTERERLTEIEMEGGLRFRAAVFLYATYEGDLMRRRLVADHVVTEHDCRGTRTADDPIALASYGMDSHDCRRRRAGFVMTSLQLVMTSG